ncbi:MAG: trigger factor [Actinobacteria bacterium]|nr:trigger factor [Actinomycetota bacterium]
MKTSLEQLEPTKVKLTVEVEPARVRRAFDQAARHLAQDIQLPGFRKGKVPRKLLESKLGKGTIAQHAMEDFLGEFYAEAIEAEDVRPVAPPDLDLQHFDEEEGCAFEATVEVRPEVELPDHHGINVAFPDHEVTDADVDEQLEQMRERFAELDEVDRPAKRGDYVTIDLTVRKGGEVIEDAAAEDAMYEVGSGGVTPKLDEELPGAVAGQSLTYVDELPEDYPEHGGENVEFTVVVKDVRAKELPPLDDDFAMTASEFDTLEELREDIRRNLRQRKMGEARQDLRAQILEAYLALVDVPLPEAMVEDEAEGRLGQIREQAEQYGLGFEELVEMQGGDPEELTANIQKQAAESVKARLVLEALAEKLDVEAEVRDLEQEIMRHAYQRNVDPRELAQAIDQQGSMGMLAGDVIRRKTLDFLVESAEIEGAPSHEELVELGFEPADEDEELPDEAAPDADPHPPEMEGEEEPPADLAEDVGSYQDDEEPEATG